MTHLYTSTLQTSHSNRGPAQTVLARVYSIVLGIRTHATRILKAVTLEWSTRDTVVFLLALGAEIDSKRVTSMALPFELGAQAPGP